MNMNTKRILVQGSKALLLVGVLQLGSTGAPIPGLATAAQAVVGAPLTPVSVAGVARRTARRTTAAAASASASQQQAAAAQQQAVAQQQAAAPQQQAAASQQQAAAPQQQAVAPQQEALAPQQQAAEAPAAKQEAAGVQEPAAKLPVGTTVSSLPSGCTTENLEGVDYFNCAGTYYRAAFQSNNVVYVVSEPGAGPA